MGIFAAQVGATVNLHPRVFELTQLRPRIFPLVPRWRHSLRRVSMEIWCSRLRLSSRYVGLSKGHSVSTNCSSHPRILIRFRMFSIGKISRGLCWGIELVCIQLVILFYL
jgi:hypothetical protein